MATIINGTADHDVINRQSSTVSFQVNGFDGDDEIITGSGSDLLNGGDGNDYLMSGAGKDTLSGGAGADFLEGGAGDDVYLVDEDDTVSEEFNQGIDLIKASSDFVLSDNVENLELTGLAIAGTGNSLNNKITGNNAANLLSGMGGKDTLIGGLGDDIYEIDITQSGSTEATIKVVYADSVTETATGGNDTVKVFGQIAGLDDLETTSINVNFGLIANTEHLDISNLQIYGNVLFGASLLGNNVANRLVGSTAADTLDGGADASIANIQDTLIGGDGDDTYKVDIALLGSDVVIQDSVLEEENGGADTLLLRGQVTLSSSFNFGLVANTENIDASGTGLTKLNLLGNDSENLLIANDANNILSGDAGNDTLDGGSGADTMYGGVGNDTYLVDDVLDVVIEEGTDDSDLIETTLLVFDLNSVNVANIESLIYTGSASFSGTGNELDNFIFGNNGDDIIDGGDGDDRLYGGAGNDTIIGGGGNDDLVGESGDDTYVIDGTENIYELEDGGTDVVMSSISYTLYGNVENLVLLSGALTGTGNDLNNLIQGNAEANVLAGKGGADTLIGGDGDDVYEIEITEVGDTVQTYKVVYEDEVIEEANEGNDTTLISAYFNGIEGVEQTNLTINSSIKNPNVENLDVSGVSASSSVILKLNLLGNALANQLIGNSDSNIVDGGGGISGLAAIDTLMGGDGDDTYVVDMVNVAGSLLVQDIIQDSDGIDTLKLRAPLTLATAMDVELIEGVENIDASATASSKLNLVGDMAANVLTGNAANNVISGAQGDDTLIGGLGKDTLIGGDGNDYYIVDASDVIVEDGLDNSFDDTVFSTASFSLVNFALIENLILGGSSAINGVGNIAANHLIGNGAANSLSGGSGEDLLEGGSGNDTLDGGDGADVMYGALGNDTYYVDHIDDFVYEYGVVEIDGELFDKDIDKVLSTISYDLNISANVEHLTLAGLDAIDATGNDLKNLIIGNVADNQMIGGAGVDTLKGGKGNDTYVVQLMQTNADDSIAKVKLEDVITELSKEGFDSLLLTGDFSNLASLSSLTLAANFEKIDASATGFTSLNITGNLLNNYLIGNDAVNVLSGGAGNDTIEAGGGDRLIGGAGNDTYILSDTTVLNNDDVLVELANGGVDTLVIEVGFDLNSYAQIENLYLTGTADINGIGNKLSNYLMGNDGNNSLIGGLGNDTLEGGLGADVLVGGLGNDSFVIHDNEDSVIEDAVAGFDTIQSTISLNLTDYSNIEHLTLFGTNAINATGNDVANMLLGNAAANTLRGGLGVDTLKGGAGNDSYQVNLLQSTANVQTAIVKLEDVISESANQGDDTLVLLGDFSTLVKITALTLATNIEHLDASATGTTKLNLVGNSANNLLTGNDFANQLNGGIGNDTLAGGLGADTLIGAAGGDSLVGGADADKLEGGAGNDTLQGGDGADIFVFNTLLNATSNLDIINDFQSGIDKLLLDRSFFSKLAVGNLSELNFYSSANSLVPFDNQDFIYYDNNTGDLFYDSDGSGNALAIKFAVLTGGVAVSASDFIIVT